MHVARENQPLDSSFEDRIARLEQHNHELFVVVVVLVCLFLASAFV